MNIVYSSSDAYAVCTGISMYSLFENNQEEKTLDVYILSTDISEANKNVLKSIATKFDRRLVFIEAKNDFERVAKQFQLPLMRGSYNCYSRIILNTWFSHLDKVIVIDSDTMVCGSIKKAWNLDMSESYFAIAPEIAAYGNFEVTEDPKVIEMHDCYYNTGICVANLKKWRDDNADEKLRRCIANENEPIKVADQTIINKYFNDKILRLPLEYNYYTPVHNVSYDLICSIFSKKNVFTKDEFQKAAENPVIIHYFGHSYERPWFKYSVALKKKDYLRIKSSTLWGDLPLDRWRSSGSTIFTIYDLICYILLCLNLYSVCLKFRYVWGQKIKRIISIKRK